MVLVLGYHVAGFIMFVVLSQSHMLLKLFVNIKIKNDPMFSLNVSLLRYHFGCFH